MIIFETISKNRIQAIETIIYEYVTLLGFCHHDLDLRKNCFKRKCQWIPKWTLLSTDPNHVLRKMFAFHLSNRFETKTWIVNRNRLIISWNIEQWLTMTWMKLTHCQHYIDLLFAWLQKNRRQNNFSICAFVLVF